MILGSSLQLRELLDTNIRFLRALSCLMGKSKDKKEGSAIPQKQLHSRLSYLYQAAEYLETITDKDTAAARGFSKNPKSPDAVLNSESKQSLYLLSQLRSVSRKSQLRLSQELKRSLCRKCSTRLIPGHTSSDEIENLSSGGKKPWADVLCVTCLVCGVRKRYPVGARRQSKTS